jgi:hypothetical protein
MPSHVAMTIPRDTSTAFGKVLPLRPPARTTRPPCPRLTIGHVRTHQEALAKSKFLRRAISFDDTPDTRNALAAYRALVPLLPEGVPFKRPAELMRANTLFHEVALKGVTTEVRAEAQHTQKALWRRFPHLGRAHTYREVAAEGLTLHDRYIPEDDRRLTSAFIEMMTPHLTHGDPALRALAIIVLSARALHAETEPSDPRFVTCAQLLSGAMAFLAAHYIDTIEASPFELAYLMPHAPHEGRNTSPTERTPALIEDAIAQLKKAKPRNDATVGCVYAQLALKLMPLAIDAYAQLFHKIAYACGGTAAPLVSDAATHLATIGVRGGSRELRRHARKESRALRYLLPKKSLAFITASKAPATYTSLPPSSLELGMHTYMTPVPRTPFGMATIHGILAL